MRGALHPAARSRHERGAIPACAGSTSSGGKRRRPLRDHPRVRGEHDPVRDDAELVRGTIPACAGSTSAGSPAATRSRDHPRVRGEHILDGELPEGTQGPSPRARGAPRLSREPSVAAGTIPACAGSTGRPAVELRARRDHPRVRGEHPAAPAATFFRRGPSPRARGALPHHPAQLPEQGTIPACAGSTADPVSGAAGGWDHPRMRGEHSAEVSRYSRDRGPSPHARGARPRRRRRERGDGTIPACAGSTIPRGKSRAPARDHPRMRGEHAAASCGVSTGVGPSPHARGAQFEHSEFVRNCGTIPACAGSTPRPPARAGGRRDHPRMRGEHPS